MGRGKPIDPSGWPEDRPRRTFFEELDRVHRAHGLRSLRDIATAMNLKAPSRVSLLLRGTLPADVEQARDLIKAMGGSEEDVRRGVLLYRTITSPEPHPGAADRVPARQRRGGSPVGRQRPFAYRDSYRPIIEAMERYHSTLLDREQEIAELLDMIHKGPGYLAVEGEIFAGKTALLTSLRRRLIDDGYAVIIYFVRRGSDDNAGGFLPPVITQLLEFLEESDPQLRAAGVVDTSEARSTQFSDLWERASRLAGRPFALIVDGLDEQHRSPGERSISDLLPAGSGKQGRIVVSSRPNPELSSVFPVEHPLAALAQDHRFVLRPSIHAKAHQEKVERELREFLSRDAPGTDLIASMYALGAGPVSDDDLADLLECSGMNPYSPLKVAREREALMPSLLSVPGPGGAPCYTFGHEAQRAHIADRIGAAGLRALTRSVLAWSDHWASAGWPDDTPAFLRDYLHVFIRARNAPDTPQRLVALLSDERRRMHWRAHGHLAVMSEVLNFTIEAVVPLPSSPHEVSLYLQLLLQRLRIITVSAIPYSLVKALVATGQGNRAYGAAVSLATSGDRQAGLELFTEAMAECGPPEQVVDLVAEYAQSWEEGQPRCWGWISQISKTLAERGNLAAATAVARHIRDNAARAEAFAGLARRAKDRDSDDTNQIIDSAVQAAYAAERADKALALARVASCLFILGRDKRAVELSRDLARLGGFAEDTMRLAAQVFIQAGQLEDAVRIAEQLASSYTGASTTARVIRELGRAGDLEQATQLVQLIIEANYESFDPEEGVESWLWTCLLTGITQSGASEDAFHSVLVKADESLHRIRDNGKRAEETIRLAEVLARGGRTSHATSRAASLDAPESLSRVYGRMAAAFLGRGETGPCLHYAARAGEQAGLISDHAKRATALANSAALMHGAGDGDGAVPVADRAITACCAMDVADRRVKKLIELTGRLISAGLPGQGMECANRTVIECAKLASVGKRAELLLELSRLLCTVGESERGAQVADNALQPAPR